MTVEILIGDCRQMLATLPEKSVHCVVTSPPYFGLRDYGVSGQLGLEPTPEEFVAAMVEVFRDVRRVLRDDGTLWLNLGDSYGGKKQLLGIPWRVAFALQTDGWYLRQDIIWHKPNPMPESVKDRCTKAHEYIFLLSKELRYFFDADAIKEIASEFGKPSVRKETGRRFRDANAGIGDGMRTRPVGRTCGNPERRNKRSVWVVIPKPFKGAHFATFPPNLIEPCVLAGCPSGGTVLDPFGGSGTTGLVAQAHGRSAILCELNPEYATMARERIDGAIATPAKKRASKPKHPPAPTHDILQVSLF